MDGRRLGGPIVVIGVDALDIDLVMRWVEEGRLPFIGSLLERGSLARLESLLDMFGDAAWPSLNTGVSPATHAFFNHLQLIRGTLDIERIDAHHGCALPFWHYLKGAGLEIATLDVPKTFPIEGLDGVQMSGWGEHYPLLRTPASLPSEVAPEIVDPLHGFVHPLEIVDPPSRKWEHETAETLLGNIESQRRATEALMARREWDFLFSVFSSLHYAGHQFHHHMDPAHWAHEQDAPQALRDALPDMATRTDAAIASLFEKLPEDATWFVLSVHGMEPNFSANHLMEEVLQRLGYLVPAKKTQPTNLVGRLLQLTGGLRALIPASVRDRINARLPESFHDQADSSAFKGGWDWWGTRVFQLPCDHFQSLLSLNLAGRDPRGIIEPGAAEDALIDEIRGELLELENPDTGAPAITAVLRTSDVYQGSNLSELPDLVVQWAKDKPISALRHPKIGVVSAGRHALRKSQHAPDGFLIGGGRGIAPGRTVEGGRTIDFAPTILRLLGQPIPGALEGRVLEDLLSA